MFALTIKNELSLRIQIYARLSFADFLRFYQAIIKKYAVN